MGMIARKLGLSFLYILVGYLIFGVYAYWLS